MQIFYLFKHRGERAYLLHVNNGRYAQYAIPVREGTTIYTDTPEIKTPTNCIKINATECFPCNILPLAEHSKNTLRSRRGIPCDQSWETSHVTNPGRILPSIILECLWQTMKMLVTL